LGSNDKSAHGPLNHGLAAIGDVPANDDVPKSGGKANPFSALKDI